jgi:hypothetical protein
MAGKKSGAVDRADLLSYLALQDTIRWQGPALALAAQAFLLTIATAEKGTTFTRAVAASLGLVTALAAFDLVIRKTRQVGSIKEQLDKIGFSPDLLRPATPPSVLWLIALGLFALADLAILTIVTFGSPWGVTLLWNGKTSSLAGWLAFGISVFGLIVMFLYIHFGQHWRLLGWDKFTVRSKRTPRKPKPLIGVARFGRPLDRENPIAVGVLGNALPISGDLSASYGGWFRAGPLSTAPLHIEPSESPDPPKAAQCGDLFVDSGGGLWFCESTDPATWRQVQLK